MPCQAAPFREESVSNTYCDEKELKGLDLTDPNPIALMYQTGYLTIKDYDLDMNMYQLGIPNEEVKDGLFNILLPYYAKFQSETDARTIDSWRIAEQSN